MERTDELMTENEVLREQLSGWSKASLHITHLNLDADAGGKGRWTVHGGRIWAESDGPGLGARFTFTLPAVTGDPEEAVRLLADERLELDLLDLMLPGMDGLELMQAVLGVADVPVIFLSAYGRDEVVARALELGAVDYVVKPFSPTELAARIRAALRRRVAAEPSAPYVLGDLTIDYAQRRVTLAGNRVQLTPTEYGMLAELSAHAGQVLTHEHLLERVWRDRGDGNVRSHAHHGQQAPP